MEISRKSIVIISASILSRPSASVVCIMELCDGFKKHGFKTKLCVAKIANKIDYLFNYYGVKNPFDIIEMGIPKIFFTLKIPGRGILFSILVMFKLNKFKEHIIYSRNPLIFFIFSVLKNQKCFFEAHQFRYKLPFQTILFNWLIKRSTNKYNGQIICISRSLMKYFVSYGINQNKICISHDAVNIDKFENTLSKVEARKKLGINLTIPIVIYTGSLFVSKGIKVLIKCANRLKDISFIIIGGTINEIKKYKKYVKNKNIIFIEKIAPVNVAIYQAAADILVLPNTKGSVIDDVTSPLKLFEYMASGRPIVATNIPSILEILRDHFNALISPAGDDIQLSKNIRLIIENPILGETLSKNAKASVEKYTLDFRIRFLKHLFLDL